MAHPYSAAERMDTTPSNSFNTQESVASIDVNQSFNTQESVISVDSHHSFNTQESVISVQSIRPLSTQQSSSFVLMCVDESVESLRAFDWFYNNLYRGDHVIGIVHIYSPPPVSQRISIGGTNYEEKMEQVFQIQKKYIDMCVERRIQFKLLWQEKSESTGRTICDLVAAENPSCVVIGQRGLGAVKRTIYGSVSDFVLHHAHIPVVVVPPPK